MRKPFTLFISAFLCAFMSHAQISVTGNSSPISTPVNAPAIVVDNTLSITSGTSFDGAKVSVSTNFNTGDVLAYTGTLPSAVTASYNATTGVLTFTGVATPAQYETLLRTVTFQTSSTVALQRTILFNLGSAIAYSANGHLYEFVSGSLSWTAAKTAASGRTLYGMQGYLATITTQGEDDFITQKLGSDGWIGSSDDYSYINTATGTTTYANQTASEGNWYWVTGPEAGTKFSAGNGTPTQITFMNWNAGEPNNSSSNEHYGEIFASTSVGKWNDLANASSLGYVVEYGGMAGDPLVDVIHSRPVTLIATSLQATGANNIYSLHATATAVDNGLMVYSASTITNATVTISNGFNSGDVLNYTVGSLPSGVTPTYNSTTGVLSFTGSATPSAWQALFRTVTFYSTSNVIGNRTLSFSVGNLVSGTNGHFYEYVSGAATWSSAKTTAGGKTYLGLQGYLATITTQAENDFIKQKLSADGWIGASDDYSYINAATGAATYANQTASEGKWYWVVGPEAGTQMTTGNAPNGTSLPPVFGAIYNNWNTGEPNNTASTEHYAEFYFSGTNSGKWNDLNGTSTLGYVVEYGGMASDPLLQLSANRTIVITNVLPVSGLEFNAVKKDETALLTWSTEAEQKTKQYAIMHSTDGISFTKVGDVQAPGSVGGKTTYSFTHTAPNAGINYYQLRIIDLDGRTTSSLIKQVLIKGKLRMYPNPVSGQFSINNPFGGASQLTIKNAGGALVLKQSMSQLQTNVNVHALPAGVYFVEVTQANNASETLRFIKK